MLPGISRRKFIWITGINSDCAFEDGLASYALMVSLDCSRFGYAIWRGVGNWWVKCCDKLLMYPFRNDHCTDGCFLSSAGTGRGGCELVFGCCKKRFANSWQRPVSPKMPSWSSLDIQYLHWTSTALKSYKRTCF